MEPEHVAHHGLVETAAVAAAGVGETTQRTIVERPVVDGLVGGLAADFDCCGQPGPEKLALIHVADPAVDYC